MTEKYDITDYLKDDKELQKAVIEEFLKENTELKAENGRLRTCLEMQRTDETNQYITKVNVERENYKLKQTLQEIKKIAEYSIMHNHNLNSNYQLILQLIKEVESKG